MGMKKAREYLTVTLNDKRITHDGDAKHRRNTTSNFKGVNSYFRTIMIEFKQIVFEKAKPEIG